MVRRIAALATIALGLVASGCAVGNFVTGAPSARAMTPASLLLERRCNGCHRTPDPAAMTSAAWQQGLARMKTRMHLPAADWDSLAAMPTLDAHS